MGGECVQEPLVIFIISLMLSYMWMPIDLAILLAMCITVLLKLLVQMISFKEQKIEEKKLETFCSTKEKATIEFLDETDLFIKQLYDFARPDDPAYATSAF